MNFEELSDDEWVLVSALVSDEPPIRLNRRGRPRAEPRVVANAVLWILTTGESWSRLPARYPSGPTCRRRFEEWHVSGTLGELVKLLVQRGRSFVYVPEPVQPQAPVQSAQAAQSVAAVAEEVVEDDGLPAVYWKSPEAWQAPAAVADAPLANPIESMTRQLVSLDNGQAPSGTPAHAQQQVPHRSQPTHASGSVPRQADASVSAPVASRTVVPEENEADIEPAGDMPWTSATPPAVQTVEWRGCEIQLSVEFARNDMYRAAVEIIKDGKRMERSGLIGPPFEDCEAARHYAFEWARQWIERELPASAGASSAGGVSASANGSALALPYVSSNVSNSASNSASAAVVTRTMPAVASSAVNAVVAANGVAGSNGANGAAGNVRIAPLQRYASTAVLRNGGEAHDTSSANGAGADRHHHIARYRTHLG
ncbi:transposase [Paraburkholderia tagetis]|uniref:Transposase n=1 Tax=Paraburkholderia tagetis TaxID=2913261 RepID=A0A9X1UDG6_9BURK|nr:transposase [Paraburkholderia tagetis]MCG5072609.1 transposase [Paraburkholderia tagetis]